MSNSDNTRGGRQGQPGNPLHPQQPGWPQYPQQTYPQHPQVPGYDPRYAGAPGYPPQPYPPASMPPFQGHVAPQQSPMPGGYGEAVAAQVGGHAGEVDYGVPPVPGFAPPADDYYYPQGQNILPDVPPTAMPPEMSGATGLGGDVPYEPQAPYAAHPHGHDAQAHPGYQGGYPSQAPAAAMEYGEGAPDHVAVEQISHRLAQLQSQYDQEMVSAGWQTAQHGQHQGYADASQGYVAPQEPVPDYQQSYHQPQAQPEPAGRGHVPQHSGLRQPTLQADPNSYHQTAPQGHNYHDQRAPAGYRPADEGRGYGEPMAAAAAHDPRASYQQEGHAPFAAGTMVAQQVAEPGGRSKLMLAGAFVVALVLGGGAAYTFKYTSLLGGRSGEASAPVVKATSEPVKVVSEAQSGDAASHNRAMHERLSGMGAAADGDRVVAATQAGDSAAPAASGMLPPSAQAADNGDAGGLRRVKTLIVRPDGTIVPPGSDAGEAVAPAKEAPEAKVKAAVAEPAAGRDSERTPPAVEPKPVVAAPKPQPVREKAAPKPAAAAMVQRAAPAEKEVAAVAPPATEATGDIGEPYLVQVTSRNSPSDALAAFADMQQKYPGLMGTYAPDIERADLGDKGIWYRLRVGPVSGKTAAADLCSKLKAAGHSGCFVRRK
jgi:cell division protein FtsN